MRYKIFNFLWKFLYLLYAISPWFKVSKPQKIPSQFKKQNKIKYDEQFHSSVSYLWRFPCHLIQLYANLTIFLADSFQRMGKIYLEGHKFPDPTENITFLFTFSLRSPWCFESVSMPCWAFHMHHNLEVGQSWRSLWAGSKIEIEIIRFCCSPPFRLISSQGITMSRKITYKNKTNPH